MDYILTYNICRNCFFKDWTMGGGCNLMKISISCIQKCMRIKRKPNIDKLNTDDALDYIFSVFYFFDNCCSPFPFLFQKCTFLSHNFVINGSIVIKLCWYKYAYILHHIIWKYIWLSRIEKLTYSKDVKR